MTGCGMRIRISAETIPGEGFSGARIIRKEAQKMFRQEGIRMPQPVISNYNEEKSSAEIRIVTLLDSIASMPSTTGSLTNK
jgi:small-conductance mechanosensitive channel